MRQDTFRRKTRRRFFRFFGILPLQKKSGSRRRANFSAQGGKGTQSGKPFAGAARFFSVGLCGLRFAEPPLRPAGVFCKPPPVPAFRFGKRCTLPGSPCAGEPRCALVRRRLSRRGRDYKKSPAKPCIYTFTLHKNSLAKAGAKPRLSPKLPHLLCIIYKNSPLRLCKKLKTEICINIRKNLLTMNNYACIIRTSTKKQ